MNAVEVEVRVDVEMTKSGFDVVVAEIENLPQGVVVPTPTLPPKNVVPVPKKLYE